MTQTQVADAMNVSLSIYRGWESEAAKLPAGKINKLAKVLDATKEELLGLPKRFDLMGIDESIGDENKYYGEVAFHFENKDGSLLLPISEAECDRLHGLLQEDAFYITVESLDNRLVFIRRSALKDVFISSEAYDDFGPEAYEEQLGIFPDDEFWDVIENMEYLESFSDEHSPSKFEEEVLNQIRLTEKQLDELIKSGDIAEDDREKVRNEVRETTEKFLARARNIVWQFSSGQVRSVYCLEDDLINAVFTSLERTEDKTIYLPIEGYHRSIYINAEAIDFISVPTHKYHAGELENIEKEMDG
jgi:transcriptional regulator with XRE-family HTH domain